MSTYGCMNYLRCSVCGPAGKTPGQSARDPHGSKRHDDALLVGVEGADAARGQNEDFGEAITPLDFRLELLRERGVVAVGDHEALPLGLAPVGLDRIRKLQALSETYVVASDFNSKRFRDISSRRLCQPYQAIIQWDRAIVLPMSSAFQSKTLPYHTHEVQFESSKQLFSSLLSLAEPFKIISPPWLKDQYDRFLRLFSEKNA